MADFERAFAFTIAKEGSKYTNDPRDLGGATRYGITLATLSGWRGVQCEAEDVECLDLDEAKAIYKAHYWNPLHGNSLPDCLALAVFDAAVNNGTDRSIKWLQSALNVITDGIVGPSTTRAAKACNAGEITNDILNLRLNFMKGLPSWKYFGKGWSNRIAALRLECFA